MNLAERPRFAPSRGTLSPASLSCCQYQHWLQRRGAPSGPLLSLLDILESLLDHTGCAPCQGDLSRPVRMSRSWLHSLACFRVTAHDLEADNRSWMGRTACVCSIGCTLVQACEAGVKDELQMFECLVNSAVRVVILIRYACHAQRWVFGWSM
jgi:hypothetical protein